MDCDGIARYYRFFEYCAFGRALERRRSAFIDVAADARRALILGDGDGRFTAHLLKVNPELAVDYVEASARMIEQAAARIHGSPRIRFMKADARAVALDEHAYDLIVTHFFLDCFSSRDLEGLVDKLGKSAAQGSRWVISEFQQPESGWRALHAELWLAVMYFFFRLATGLVTQQLPPYRNVLERHGWNLEQRSEARAGLIASELWTRE